MRRKRPGRLIAQADMEDEKRRKHTSHCTKQLKLKMDRDRRSGTDRRKQTNITIRTFVGNGNRTIFRRQGDQGHLYLVDRYSPSLFVAIVSILFLCAIDAILTLFLLNHGASEANPIINYLLNIGPYAFFLFKYGLTIIGVFCLLFFRGAMVREIYLTKNAFLYLTAWIYVAVIGWELFLVYHVV